MNTHSIEDLRRSLSGPVVALTTPMDASGEVDFEGLERLVRYYLDGGITAFIAAGTTGYCYALSRDEHVAVVRRVVDTTRGRGFVLAGVSHSGTREANRLADGCEEAGADALLMTPPYYYQSCIHEGRFRHYRDVAQNHSLPLVVYSIFGADLDVDFFKRCAEVENIAGVKEATGDYNHARDLLIELGRRFVVIGGGSMRYFLWHWLWGARGYVTSIANMLPRIELEFYRALENNDVEAAREVVVRYEQPFFKAMLSPHSWHESLHSALQVFGLPAGSLRLPLVEPPEEHRSYLRTVFTEIGLLGNGAAG